MQNCLQKSGTSIQRKQWVDLSFLNAQAASESPRLYGIRPVQFSLVICGSDNRRWIAYAFDDTDPEIEDLPTENLSPEGLHDPEAEEDLQAEQPNCDPIRDVPDPQGLDPNHALWDPREYFLFGIEIGIAKPLDKWERLVRCLERGIKQYVYLSEYCPRRVPTNYSTRFASTLSNQRSATESSGAESTDSSIQRRRSNGLYMQGRS